MQVHREDNGAIVVNEGGLPAGMVFASGLIPTEAVPEAHKGLGYPFFIADRKKTDLA